MSISADRVEILWGGALTLQPSREVPVESQFRSSDLPLARWATPILRFLKTAEVLFFKGLQFLAIFRPRKSILGLPSIATSQFTLFQALVNNGTQEEVLGFRPRRLLHRILKGIPDVEMFEHVEFTLSYGPHAMHTVVGSTDTRGFIHLQVPFEIPRNVPDTAWLRMRPLGVDTLLGRIQLGDYEVVSTPIFFLTPRVKWVVVSDIDDTIKDSNIAETTSLKSILQGLFRGNFYTYAPIVGMAKLYKELIARGSLIVYLTSTPYQLGPFLLKFLRDCGFPEGPVFLRWLGYGRVRHKWRSLLRLIESLGEEQQCLLIGDSGEKDLHIYRRLCDHPRLGKKVSKILIRHVPGTPVQSPINDKEVFYNRIEELAEHLHAIVGP